MSLLAFLAVLIAPADPLGPGRAPAPADATVSMLDGQRHSGQLVAISAQDVSLNKGGANIKLPIADVMAIELPMVKVAPSDEPQSVVLIDESQLRGSAVTRTAKHLNVESAGLGMLTIENTAIQSVRLQPENPAWRSQWNTFLKRESDKDLLIVAKRDGSGLDFLAGVISAISQKKIDFLLDGETVPVPAARVYGAIFARSEAPQPAVPTAVQITTTSGNLISARSVSLQDGDVLIETVWGKPLKTTVGQIQKIDLSSGRIRFLSDLEALTERFDGVDPEGSLFAGLIDKNQETLLFGPRRDTTMEPQSKLQLRGREYSKGLWIHSRTEISWALDQRFSSLDCIVGVDDAVAFNGAHAVFLRISGDGNVLLEKLVSTTDEPVPLRVPLAGVSTLTILVDFGDGDSTCDWLDLADAKLVIAKDKP